MVEPTKVIIALHPDHHSSNVGLGTYWELYDVLPSVLQVRTDCIDSNSVPQT